MAQAVATEVFPDFLQQDATLVAERLLGCYLERTIGDITIRVRIVETESYDQADAASHSFLGQTPRTDVMFGPAGHLYVYFTYGMHYCCNVVTGEAGEGAAVLIRAVEPVSQHRYIEAVRGRPGPAATNGPAKLCQALGIDKSLNGHDLRRQPLRLLAGSLGSHEHAANSTRIGISKERDALRRFYIKDNAFISHPNHN